MGLRIVAAAVVLLVVAGCGGSRHLGPAAERAAIANAKRVYGFAQFSDIFPSKAETVSCSVAAGPLGNVFKGRCSTAVIPRAGGGATVLFTQDFGAQGRHRWRVRVSSDGTASLVSQSGGGLVQLIR